MKNSTVQKAYCSTQTSQIKNNGNNSEFLQTSIGIAMDKYEKSEKSVKDAKKLSNPKDNSR